MRLSRRLSSLGWEQHVILSEAARVVLAHEIDLKLHEDPVACAAQLADHLRIPSETLRVHGLKDWFSPAASGSSGIRHMVIVPCSMGTLARIAHGMSDNLIERAADVQLKERGTLILVPRETPLSSVHLENMLALTRAGAIVLPAMPGFYQSPTSVADLVDFIVDRILDHLHENQAEVGRWGV